MEWASTTFRTNGVIVGAMILCGCVRHAPCGLFRLFLGAIHPGNRGRAETFWSSFVAKETTGSRPLQASGRLLQGGHQYCVRSLGQLQYSTVEIWQGVHALNTTPRGGYFHSPLASSTTSAIDSSAICGRRSPFGAICTPGALPAPIASVAVAPCHTSL